MPVRPLKVPPEVVECGINQYNLRADDLAQPTPAKPIPHLANAFTAKSSGEKCPNLIPAGEQGPYHWHGGNIQLLVVVIDLKLQIVIRKSVNDRICVDRREHGGDLVQHRVQCAPMRARDPSIPSYGLCANDLLCDDPVLGPLQSTRRLLAAIAGRFVQRADRRR